MFLWRLGCNMFRSIGHTGCCRADFAKLVALKFFRPALSVCRQPLLSLSPTKIVNYTNMFRIIGHTGRCIADFARLVAPRSFIVRCCGPWFAQVVEIRPLLSLTPTNDVNRSHKLLQGGTQSESRNFPRTIKAPRTTSDCAGQFDKTLKFNRFQSSTAQSNFVRPEISSQKK